MGGCTRPRNRTDADLFEAERLSGSSVAHEVLRNRKTLVRLISLVPPLPLPYETARAHSVSRCSQLSDETGRIALVGEQRGEGRATGRPVQGVRPTGHATEVQCVASGRGQGGPCRNLSSGVGSCPVNLSGETGS